MIKEGGQEQSPVECRKTGMDYGENRNYFPISHGKDEWTDEI